MSRQLSISDTGLRLIKAFEGYRPVDRELVTGARVVGHGHRVVGAEPRRMTREQADETLRLELQAYEELINEEVHAPLSQSQFDALCSLAFNIGPKAFRGSDTLRALNNGRVLDAANGFDIWRKSTISGKTYVVDALMRRRTAEKSLFLRTERSVPAPSALVPPSEDADAAALKTDDGLPVFTEAMSEGVVAKAPYAATPNPLRRREDGPSGILTLSEVIDPADTTDLQDADDGDELLTLDDILDDAESDVAPAETEEPKLSVIRDAADALGDRLGALIDGESDGPLDDDPNWPQSLIRPAGDEDVADDDAASNLLAFPGTTQRLSAQDIAAAKAGANADEVSTLAPPSDAAPIVIDEIAADDVLRASRPANGPVFVPSDEDAADGPSAGLWIPVILGFALLSASVTALWLGAQDLLGEWGPMLALAGSIVGALMIVFSLYSVAASAGEDR